MLKQLPNDNNTIHPDSGSAQNSTNSLEWALDQELATRHLIEQITDPEICGAILFSQDQQVISYAGDIIESTAKQIIDTISHYWDAQHHSEIARFLSLKTSQVDYLLFALPFTQDLVLAVLFEPNYPLNQVRTQSKKLRHNLITITPVSSDTSEPTPTPTESDDILNEDEEYEAEYDLENDEYPDIDISDLLVHMPPPDPEINTQLSPETQQAAQKITEGAIPNDPSTIPSFLVPPSAQSEWIESDLAEEQGADSLLSDQEEEAQTLPQDDIVPEDAIFQVFIQDELSTADLPDSELIKPFIEEFEEEPESQHIESDQEVDIDSIQDTIPEPTGEPALIDISEDSEEVEEIETDEDMDSIPASFSLETDLILPWEMEENQTALQVDQEAPSPKQMESISPSGEPEITAEETEIPGNSAQEDPFLDLLDNDLEGIPLPNDESGWLAPFAEHEQTPIPDTNEATAPIFTFEEETTPSANPLIHEAFTIEEEQAALPTDVKLEEELLSSLDHEVPAMEETTDSVPQVEFEETSPPAIEEIIPDGEHLREEAIEEQQIEEEIDSQSESSFESTVPLGFPYELPDQIVSDTRPNRIMPVPPSETDENQTNQNEQAYTCVLVPNLPDNTLTGSLAKMLGEWLPQLSESFGWHLEKITIRPSYLQWTVEVPQTVSTGRLVHNIRIHTSQRVYDHFPELKRRSPEDFWSPSQLIISGEQSPTTEMLENFINKSRQYD